MNGKNNVFISLGLKYILFRLEFWNCYKIRGEDKKKKKEKDGNNVELLFNRRIFIKRLIYSIIFSQSNKYNNYK